MFSQISQLRLAHQTAKRKFAEERAAARLTARLASHREKKDANPIQSWDSSTNRFALPSSDSESESDSDDEANEDVSENVQVTQGAKESANAVAAEDVSTTAVKGTINRFGSYDYSCWADESSDDESDFESDDES